MSPAEERIRLKAEAALRENWQSARIIHELVLEQGGVRIDLAAVTPDRLIVAEIKSERDVMTRLEDQYKAACRVADGVLVVVAEKHLAKAREVAGWLGVCHEDEVGREIQRDARRVYEATCNAPARLNMLWADELRRVAGVKGNRSYAIRYASDSMTGSEVRRRVCAALRARQFPRADPPILSELFPAATVFTR